MNFEEEPGLPPVVFVGDSGKILDDAPRYDFFLTDRQINLDSDWSEFLPEREILPLDLPRPLNRSIPPGESITIYLGFTADIYDGLDRVADYALVAVNARFSEGPSVPLRKSIRLPGLRLRNPRFQEVSP